MRLGWPVSSNQQTFWCSWHNILRHSDWEILVQWNLLEETTLRWKGSWRNLRIWICSLEDSSIAISRGISRFNAMEILLCGFSDARKPTFCALCVQQYTSSFSLKETHNFKFAYCRIKSRNKITDIYIYITDIDNISFENGCCPRVI